MLTSNELSQPGRGSPFQIPFRLWKPRPIFRLPRPRQTLKLLFA